MKKLARFFVSVKKELKTMEENKRWEFLGLERKRNRKNN